MTVCIAAICNANTNSPKIVFSADRLISAGIEYEHGQPKIAQITNYCYVMVSSNDTLRSDLIVKEVQSKVLDRKPSVKDIAGLFVVECSAEKRRQQEHDVLSPLGLIYDRFLEKSNELSPDLIREITNALTYYRYKFDTAFLILGIDMGPMPTAHIYTVDQEGELRLHDYLGFAVIGSGYDLAFPELTKFSYSPYDVSWEEGLIRVYDAKKVSERSVGVGRNTSLVVLFIPENKTETQAWWPGSDIYHVLDKGIEKLKKNEFKNLNKVYRELSSVLTKAKAQADTTADDASTKTVENGATKTAEPQKSESSQEQ